MKELPILFSAPMVRAILNGTKTQTRRIVKPRPTGDDLRICQEAYGWTYHMETLCAAGLTAGDQCYEETTLRCPYGPPGDRLIVKEAAWMWCEKRPNGVTKTGRPKFHYVPLREAAVHYCEDHPNKPMIDVVSPTTGNEWGWRKKIGRFLPRWASRITLEVESIRVERLNDISHEDAIAEAPPMPCFGPTDGQRLTTAQHSFAALWESINGSGSWALNPWVWVITFKRMQPQAGDARRLGGRVA